MMSTIMGFKLHDNEDKSHWQVHLNFRGVHICLRDWKGWSWSIDVFNSGSTVSEKILDCLIKKLASSSKRYENSILKPMWNSHLQSDDFMIRNTYNKSFAHYWHLRQLSLEQITSAKLLKEDHKSVTAEPLGGIISRSLKSASQYVELSSNSTILYNASILFFYASTENIFDIGFSFLNKRDVNYLKFRSMDWAERFKFSLPEFVREHQKIYEAMYRGLKDQRHQIAHGFGGEESGLFFVPGVGYRPITYNARTKRKLVLARDKVPLLEDEEIFNLSHSLFEVFDTFEEILKSTSRGYVSAA
jgi:hypothetical protein